MEQDDDQGGGRLSAGSRGASTGARGKAAGARSATPAPLRIGVISDTHGYLDPTVAGLFRGVAHIIHAGDVGDPAVLESLEAIAPVSAVSGNVEGSETAALPREVIGEVAGVRFVVAHKPKRLLKRLAAGRISAGPKGALPDLIVFGHVHGPSVSWVDGTLYLNPGTASSPDEEDDGPTVVVVEVASTGLAARFVPLARRVDDAGTPVVTRVR